MRAVINAHLLTMDADGREIKNGYLLIKEHKIIDIGDMSELKAQSGAEIIDADGALVTPGLVDAHSHIGMWEDGLNFEGDDGNEDTDPITPQLRAIDAINPLDKAFKEAFDAGITTVVTGPGSSNPVGGQLAAVKTYGRRIDDMIVKAPAGIKFSFGENPKSAYDSKSQSPSTRMATAALIREALFKAAEYRRLRGCEDTEDTDKPEFDMKHEAFLPLLGREIPMHAHAHRADDIFTAVRIANEFDLKLVLVHCTEGHLVPEELTADNPPILSGPILTDRSKPELKNQTEAAPAILSKHGLHVSIITDHPETPEKYLRLCAAVAVKHGMSRSDALRAITINPAKACEIDGHVGSLERGKDSDIVIWDGDPLDIMSSPKIVIV